MNATTATFLTSRTIIDADQSKYFCSDYEFAKDYFVKLGFNVNYVVKSI